VTTFSTSPARSLISRRAMPLTRQPSRACQGECGSGLAEASAAAYCWSRISSPSAATSQASAGGSEVSGKRKGPFAFDQAGIQIGLGEGRAGHQAREEADVVRHADHAIVGQGLQHARQGALSGFVPDDKLGDHRVVVRRDFVILLDAGIDPHIERLGRRREVDQAADRRQEALVRVLCINPRFQRMAADRQLLLAQGQRLAGTDLQLPLDQVQAGDHFRHRMLDLQPRVHLHEIESSRPGWR
jgi:hypothetical protein